jgi:hypothetical protein
VKVFCPAVNSFAVMRTGVSALSAINNPHAGYSALNFLAPVKIASGYAIGDGGSLAVAVFLWPVSFDARRTIAVAIGRLWSSNIA